MSDREDKKLNLGDELADVKSLIAGAEDGGFSLDDILAEYGVKSPPGRSAIPLRPSPPEDDGPDLPWPEAPVPVGTETTWWPSQGEELYLRRRTAPPQDESEPEKGPSEPEGRPRRQTPSWMPKKNGDKVVEFPEEESPLASFLKDISKKADDYADRMFEESEQMDPEEVRRLETLIPGTDQETEEDLRYVRRPLPAGAPAPDLPQELARTYGKGLKGLRVRSLLVFLLAAAALVPCLLPRSLSPSPPELAVGYPLLLWISAGLLGAGMLLSLDVLAAGLWRGLRLKVGMDTLAALSCAFTLADTLLLAGSQDRGGQLSYCPAALFGLFFLLHGTYHKRCALRLSCRTAAAAAEPYLVTLDEGKWNGKDTYAKWSGTPRRLWQPDPDGRRRPAHLPGVLSRPAAGLHSLFPAGLLRHRGGGAPDVVSLRHLHCRRRLRWGTGLWPLLPQGGPPGLPERRCLGRLARRGRVPAGQPGPHHRSGPVPPRLCGAQRHQGLWGLLRGTGGGLHRHPDPGLGLWAGKALPRPAPHPGGHLPQGGQPVLL